MNDLRSLAFAAWVGLVALSSTAPAQVLAERVPNIVWDDTLTPVIERALQLSPTFRRQWTRIGELRQLAVHLNLVDWFPTGQSGAHARTQLRRYHFGRIEADIDLRFGVDLYEWIGHELEHVVEYGEGVDYRLLMRVQPGRVWIVGLNQFETQRAIEAGGRVAHEVSRARLRTE